jgi:hypothetical protein
MSRSTTIFHGCIARTIVEARKNSEIELQLIVASYIQARRKQACSEIFCPDGGNWSHRQEPVEDVSQARQKKKGGL